MRGEFLASVPLIRGNHVDPTRALADFETLHINTMNGSIRIQRMIQDRLLHRTISTQSPRNQTLIPAMNDRGPEPFPNTELPYTVAISPGPSSYTVVIPHLSQGWFSTLRPSEACPRTMASKSVFCL